MRKKQKNQLFIPKSRYKREQKTIFRRFLKQQQFICAVTVSESIRFYLVNSRMLELEGIDVVMIRDTNSPDVVGSIEGILSPNVNSHSPLMVMRSDGNNHYFMPLFNEVDLLIPGHAVSRCNLENDQGIDFSKLDYGRIVMLPVREFITDQMLSDNKNLSRLVYPKDEYMDNSIARECMEFLEESLNRRNRYV